MAKESGKKLKKNSSLHKEQPSGVSLQKSAGLIMPWRSVVSRRDAGVDGEDDPEDNSD